METIEKKQLNSKTSTEDLSLFAICAALELDELAAGEENASIDSIQQLCTELMKTSDPSTIGGFGFMTKNLLYSALTETQGKSFDSYPALAEGSKEIIKMLNEILNDPKNVSAETMTIVREFCMLIAKHSATICESASSNALTPSCH